MFTPLTRIDAVKVERLDPKALAWELREPSALGSNALHLSGHKQVERIDPNTLVWELREPSALGSNALHLVALPSYASPFTAPSPQTRGIAIGGAGRGRCAGDRRATGVGVA